MITECSIDGDISTAAGF